MAGRERTVYFFTGAEIDHEEVCHEWTWRRWSSFFDNFEQPDEPYFMRRNYYEGEIGESRAPDAKYFHILRARYLSDWPEGKDINGISQNLGANRAQFGLNEIDEYAYLLPLTGTNYVAMFRSSGGPRPAAIADWITEYLNLAESGATFVLMPVLRTNARDKLRSAKGVKALHVRFEGPTAGDSNSDIQNAVALAGSGESHIEHSDLKVDLTLTLGRAVTSGAAPEGLLREANQLIAGLNGRLAGANLTQLRAKTIQEKDDGTVAVEPVDFFKERMTVRSEFGDADTAMSPQQIVSGMFDAIRQFRDMAGEYRY